MAEYKHSVIKIYNSIKETADIACLRDAEQFFFEILTGQRKKGCMKFREYLLCAEFYETRILKPAAAPGEDTLYMDCETWQLYSSISETYYSRLIRDEEKNSPDDQAGICRNYFWDFFRRIADLWDRLPGELRSEEPKTETMSYYDLPKLYGEYAFASSNERIRKTFISLAAEPQKNWIYASYEYPQYVNPPWNHVSTEMNPDSAFLRRMLREAAILGDYDTFICNKLDHYRMTEEEAAYLLARGIDPEQLDTKTTVCSSDDPEAGENMAKELPAERAHALSCSAEAFRLVRKSDLKTDFPYFIKAIRLWKEAADGGFEFAGYPLWIYSMELRIRAPEDEIRNIPSEETARNYLFRAAASGGYAIRPVAVLAELAKAITAEWEAEENLNGFYARYGMLSPEIIAWYCRLYWEERRIEWNEYSHWEYLRERLEEEGIRRMLMIITDALDDCHFYNDMFLFRVLDHREELGLRLSEEQKRYFAVYRGEKCYSVFADIPAGIEPEGELKGGPARSEFEYWAECFVPVNGAEDQTGILSDVYLHWENWELYCRLS